MHKVTFRNALLTKKQNLHSGLCAVFQSVRVLWYKPSFHGFVTVLGLHVCRKNSLRPMFIVRANMREI